ncbi:MAG: DUF3488 and transglutaminase-like domain-containing protein [Planctomycetota bacterium]
MYERFHNASHLVASTGVLLFSVSAEAPGIGFVGVVAVLSAWLMFAKRVESPVPRVAINFGLLLATGYMLLRIAEAPTEDYVTVVAEYLVVLLLIKLFENRTPRDQAQSLALCGMLGVGAVLTNPGLFTGTLLVVHTFVLLVASTRFQMWAGHHETFAPPNTPSPGSIGVSPSAGRRTNARLIAANTLLACAIGFGGIAVFVVLPRQNEMRGLAFNIGSPNLRTVSGFRDHVQLGASGMISLSREVVGYASLETQGVALTQPVSRYFRGAVLDEYTSEGRWERSDAIEQLDDARALRPNTPGRGLGELPDTGEAIGGGGLPEGLYTIDQRITLVNKTADNLFAIAHPVQVAYPVNRVVTLNPVDTSLRLDKVPGRQAYAVRSAPNAPSFATTRELAEYGEAQARADRAFRDGAVGRMLRDLALPLMERAGLERDVDAPITPEDERIVRLFERHLTSSYGYTTDIVAPDSRAQDPTLFFLLNSRRGHCEYFASALAGLCRSVGIRARVVTGFVTSEVDGSGRYVIRQSHAHAWVEAPVLYGSPVEGADESFVVWETFDASPAVGEVEPTGGAGAVLAALRSWLYAVEDVWIGAVVGYDADAQRELIGVSGDDQVNSLAELIDSVVPVGSGSSGGRGALLRRVAPFLLALGGIVFIVLAVRGFSPAWLARGASRGRSREVARIDRALRTMGCERPEHAALLDHAGAIGGTRGRALARAADALYADRFSGQATDGVELADAIDELERIARSERTR